MLGDTAFVPECFATGKTLIFVVTIDVIIDAGECMCLKLILIGMYTTVKVFGAVHVVRSDVGTVTRYQLGHMTDMIQL